MEKENIGTLEKRPMVPTTFAFTRDQIDLIKRTVARGATDDELKLFVYHCQKVGLDPLARQIHFVKRRQKVDGEWVEIGTIQTGIDGFRVIAERTKKYVGQTPPQWCGKDGQWKDIWLGDEPPYACKVGVKRRDVPDIFWGIAYYRAMVQLTGDGKPNRIWEKMAPSQLAKCAEAAAHRKAFPQDLSGLYADEEMGQADNLPAVEVPYGETVPEDHEPVKGDEHASSAGITEEERKYYSLIEEFEGHKSDKAAKDLKKQLSQMATEKRFPFMQELVKNLRAKNWTDEPPQAEQERKGEAV